MADVNREAGEAQGTARGQGKQESEEAGMQQMSGMLREAREEGDPQTEQGQTQQGGMQGRTGQAEMAGSEGTGMEQGTEDYDVWVITVRECAICERERGMSEREHGMSERERAMFDRECVAADRERSGAWGGEEQSSGGGMTQGRSGMGGQQGSRQTGLNR